MTADRSPDEVAANPEARIFVAAESAGLFVGISVFEDPLLTAIPYAVDDAVDLAFLVSNELQLMAAADCILAISGEPAKPESRKRLNRLVKAGAECVEATFTGLYRSFDRQCQKAGKQGLLIMSFATHGFSDQGTPLIGAADTLRRRPVRTSLLLPDLIGAVSRSSCLRRLLLIDTCRGMLSPGTRDSAIPDSAFAAALADAKGTVIFSAAADGAKAFDDPGRGNGVFTAAVLDGLRGGAEIDEKGFVTARNLGEFVGHKVHNWVAGHRPELASSFPGVVCHFDHAAHDLPLAYFPNRIPSSSNATPIVEARLREKTPLTSRNRNEVRSHPAQATRTALPFSFRTSFPAFLAACAGGILAGSLLTYWDSIWPPAGREFNLNIAEILNSAWGIGSLAAFALGIFLSIVTAVIKKSRPGKFDGQQTYQFFRFAMVLAFLLALTALSVASFREIGSSSGGPTIDEKIKRLALDLKSDDLSERRQASDSLIRYGGSAADELVLVIREEARETAAEIFQQTTSGNWEVLLSMLFGAKPWNTPFLNSAAETLAGIGQPALPAIFGALAQDSAEAQILMAEQEQRNKEQQARMESTKEPNLFKEFSVIGDSFGASAAGARIAITRETLYSALAQMDPLPISDLLDGLEKPSFLVQLTCYQVLAAAPEARQATLERLRRIVQKTTNEKDRDGLLEAIQTLESQAG